MADHNDTFDSRAYLAAIVESSNDAIIGKTLDGTIVFWNAAAQRIFGYTPEEAIGQHINLIIPENRRDEEFIIIGNVRAGKRVDHFETVRQAKDGSAINLSLTISPIRNEGGEIIGASKIARDITEQKRTEQKLQELSERKDEFLANISHELRTPMNAVIGLANILSVSKSLNDKERQLVSTLKQSADGLMGLINNLLDFSRLESDSLEIEGIEFDLADMMERTVAIMNVKALEKNLPITVTYAPQMRRYYIGDSFRIQQIMVNLLSNAIKFTERGKISIHVSARETLSACATVHIDVTDTGIGIPAEKTGIIFEKFVQADASMTRKYGGSGLGLSICKALAKAMDGAISVKSQIGVGTTFSLTLPLRFSISTAQIESGTAIEAALRKNVLVTDDYAPNLVVVTAMLDMMGYDYDLAENGVEALQKLQETAYDVILMDVQMHGMDGFETTRRIRAYEAENERPPAPVIAMTAHMMESDKKRCLDSGMVGFISKPFDPAQLEARLREFIKTEA